MSPKPLYDEWSQRPKRPSSAGIPALLDPADRDDPDRPIRTEDLIPRHGGNGSPKLWLPDGKTMAYYGRPSGAGEPLDNNERLKVWESRKIVQGLLDTGQQGSTLRLRRATLGPVDENKAAHDALLQEAKRLVFDADQQGTAKHRLTEMYDLGMPVEAPDEYEDIIPKWVSLTRYMKIVETPWGTPGVECFVAMDEQRIDMYGNPLFDLHGEPIMIRMAGTFDRLFEYVPCPICGRTRYIGDLKTSTLTGLEHAMRKSGIQLGIYGKSRFYRPYEDGSGADRYSLGDVCPHRGIIVSIPPEGEEGVYWIDIARGAFKALSLVPLVKEHQSEKDWMQRFEPVPNLWALIDSCQTQREIQALWHQYPGPHWDENDKALVKYGAARVAAIAAGPKAIEGTAL